MWMKQTFKILSVQKIICFIAYIYIWFTYYTTRWEIKKSVASAKLLENKRPVIFAFWHGRLLMIPPFSANQKDTSIVVSNHSDGELIARVMKYFKFKLIRGSSSKGALSASKKILKSLKRSENIVLTPDGPRGPKMRVGGNIIRIAQVSCTPIIPVTYSASNCKFLKSWDSFLIAKPFGRGIFIVGDPIYIRNKSNKEELEEARLNLENHLNEITKYADSKMGLEVTKPA